jgi:hypothetical protein
MEHVEGRDLRAILDSARELSMPLPVPLAIYVASKVASALDYAHRRRDGEGRDLHIVHRDVSPQNILISYEGDIKLCDFGIAKAASKVSQTESGALKGKIQYMSPEQAWGNPIDRRSDLFSLGAVLYEMLTEQKLFRGESDLTVLEKVRAAAASPPSAVNSEVPKTLDAIVLRALAKEPGRPLRERLGSVEGPGAGPLLLHAGARQRGSRDLPPPHAGGGGGRGRSESARGGARRARGRSRAEAEARQGGACRARTGTGTVPEAARARSNPGGPACGREARRRSFRAASDNLAGRSSGHTPTRRRKGRRGAGRRFSPSPRRRSRSRRRCVLADDAQELSPAGPGRRPDGGASYGGARRP